MAGRVIALAAALAATVCACEWDLERMVDQPKYRAYEPNPYFSDGTTMQHPPAGTVSRTAVVGPRAVTEGLRGDAYVDRVPVAVTRALLERGRNRYDIFCAPCHGVTGEADTPVAADMNLRPPPSLVQPPITGYPPGRLYRAVAGGFGLMPSYRAQLSVSDRWAVVGYVQALQLSRRAPARELPSRLRKELP